MSVIMNKTVTKSNDKKRAVAAETSETPKAGLKMQGGKICQAVPKNDLEEFKNVSPADVMIPVPEDDSIPTWRTPTGKVSPMVQVFEEDGVTLKAYRPRAKKGPSKGKMYRPRAKKIAQIMAVADKTGGRISFDSIMAISQSAAKSCPGAPSFEAEEVNNSPDSPNMAPDSPNMGNGRVDYQALVHSWQMRSIGALTNKEFELIKNSIFGKKIRQALTQAVVEEATPIVAMTECQIPIPEEVVSETAAPVKGEIATGF